MEKARRGELLVASPVGYRKGGQRLEKDPDRRVQEAVRLVFHKLVELGSVRQTLLWFLEHGLELPVNSSHDEIRWKRPSYGMLYSMLTNPAYGGAYAYGKTEQITQYQGNEPRQSARRKPRERWLSFIPGTHEGYVSWEQFERIQTTISENVLGREHIGAARRGPALLAGVLRCRRCGHKLVVHYTGSHHDVLRYHCRRGWLDNGEPRCIGFAGLVVDQAIAREILRVVHPQRSWQARSKHAKSTKSWLRSSAIWRPPTIARGGRRNSMTGLIRRIASSPMSSNVAGIRPYSGCAKSNRRFSSTWIGAVNRSCPRARNLRIWPPILSCCGIAQTPMRG